jgi:uncharacterized protein with HEPN domain
MIRDFNLFLDDINSALEKIEEYTRGIDFNAFTQDRKTIDAVIRNFEILGEATKQIPESIKSKYSEVPWKEMAGMRDKLVHAYFGIDAAVLWETITKRIPDLKSQIQEIIKDLEK